MCFLIEKNIFNFFLDIGGEIRANGNNIKNRNWVVGIENPFEIDSNIPIATASLDNLSIATSKSKKHIFTVSENKFDCSISFSMSLKFNLYKLSTNTFVEESDELKKSAAGAGLTDND